jgi:hypothetical protein
MRLFLICCLLGVPLAGAGEKGFSQGLSENDFKAAGLDKLTPEERMRLDELVAASKTGPSAGVAAITPKAAAPEILRGKIAGTLSGWREGTLLVFEDGQRWQVVSKGTYRAAPVRSNPKVELFPLTNGDYVMTIETVPRRAQVRKVTE